MIETKLVLALTVRELDFYFDWKGWNTLQYVTFQSVFSHHASVFHTLLTYTRRRTAPPDSIGGEHIYRVGNGIGSVKDKLCCPF